MARPGLTTHRKFRRLARLLGSALIARGVLELLWEPCYEAGQDYLGTAHDIESQLQWTGDNGALVRALVECGQPEGVGFIEVMHTHDDESRTTYRVHDLWHHAPDYVMKRHARELQRKQKVAPSTKRRRSAPRGGQRPTTSNRQIEVDRTPAPAPAHAPQSAPAPAHAPGDDARARFECFWQEYPNKANRSQAEKAFARLKPDDALLARIFAALAWQRQSPKWLSEHGQYIPHGATYLNNRRWEDQPPSLPAASRAWDDIPGVDGAVSALCLKAGLTKHDIGVWFAGAHLRDRRLAIPDPNRFDWIDRHYSAELRKANAGLVIAQEAA